MRPIIKASGIGKEYRIGVRANSQGSSLRESLAQSVRAPFRRAQRRDEEARAGAFWALRDVEFEIQPGEAVGIMAATGRANQRF